ncbi:Amine oxidase [Pyrenophora tritici-repentis]|nr:Amine oxidase [Pyrenophora tritici-repentis]KAI1519997.1 Amine oxidase [Pyrenophora tritici-repentis]KAI1569741.1 DadA Glycine D-amino acid oxidase deaminating [Pyrenophora tritici-repentis]KAI1675621.1 Amine oxidase [Pyrenophora tritici-repentis]PZC88632.1 DadA, Glycine D-amino acid oxidases (deaminating) [Pyrenophora tritici-repentis]
MLSQVHDVIVVGGGAIGLAAAYEVAKAGKSTLVLEQSCLFNAAGSSNDLARMYRTMYTEPFMAELAFKSMKIWKELEMDSGTSLRTMSGLLNFGDPTMGADTPEGTLMGPIANLENMHMPFRKMTKQEMENEYPFKNLPEEWEGIFAPDNGVINVPLLLRTLARLAKDYGAHTQQYTEVKKLVPVKENDEDIWKIEARVNRDKAVSFRARKIIIATGAYTNHVVQPSFNFKLKLNIWEMVASYFTVNAGPNGTSFPSMWFQFANDKRGRSRLFYGFPTVEWGPPNVCRIAVDAATRQITDPDRRCGSIVNPEDIHDTQQFIEKHLVGVDYTTPAYTLSCLQTNTFDNMFVLDYIPEQYLQGGAKDSVAVFTAGWAMKFVPLIGRALKDMVLNGHSEYALEEFKIDRLDLKSKGKDGRSQAGIIDEVDGDFANPWEYL